MSSPSARPEEHSGRGDTAAGAAARPWRRRILSAAGWGIFLLVLVLMWPAALGGPTSYVIVTGHSMEPTLYRGDFVVLRAGDYQVGDVVSYYPVDGLPAQVIHRIIDFNEDGTAVLQGDNNSFVDPYTPNTDRIAGKMVFAVPRIGNVAWVLGRPFVWGSLVLLAVALLLYPKKTATEVSGPGRTDRGTRGDQETHGNEAQECEERGGASADADD